MKKIFLLYVSCLFLVSGCGSGQSASIDNPYEIKVGSETLSLYDDVDKFAENGFEVFEDRIFPEQNNETNCITVPHDEIYAIDIYENNVMTYKSISIGDDISKVTDTFSCVENLWSDDTVYGVCFDTDNNELPLENEADDGTFICYTTADSKIKRIFIMSLKNYKM